jgi:hypothetical protein
MGGNALESIRSSLPLPPCLDPDLHRLVDIFGPSLIIDPQLNDIAIFKLMGFALRPRGTQA